jgi:hypothetical protein
VALATFKVTIKVPVFSGSFHYLKVSFSFHGKAFFDFVLGVIGREQLGSLPQSFRKFAKRP